MKASDRSVLIAVAHGVAPGRLLTTAEQNIWTEAQSCLIGIVEAQLEEKDLPSGPFPPLPAREWTPIEWEIHSLVQRIEALGADILLTKVGIALGEAKEKLAEWLDQKGAETGNPLLKHSAIAQFPCDVDD